MKERPTARPRIQASILAGLLAVVGVLSIAGVVITAQQYRMRDAFTTLEQVQEVERLLLECRRQEKNFFLRHDRPSVELFSTNLTALVESTNLLEQWSSDADLARPYSDLGGALIRYQEAFFETERRSYSQLSTEEQDALLDTTVAMARNAHQSIAVIRGVVLARSRTATKVTEVVTYTAGGLGLLASVVLGTLLSRRIAKPFEILRAVAERASTGDIQDMDVYFGDIEPSTFTTKESVDLAFALRRMLTSLRLLIPTERGMMSPYHLAILALVQRAVGPAAWAVIERARGEAGFVSFAETDEKSIDVFVDRLRIHLGPYLQPSTCQQLCAAIRQLST